MKNFYKELDSQLKYFEKNNVGYNRTIDNICDKIDWCWKWKKISEEQKNELADRVIKILEK